MGIILFIAFSAIIALMSFMLGYIIGRVYREIIEFCETEKNQKDEA